MTEKDAIKLGYLEKYARGNVILDTRDQYHENLAFVFDQFNVLKVENASLITTIESQKEEIAKKDAALLAWMEREEKLKPAFDQLESKQIESLKAITELQKAEIAELREREYNHYPIVILDLETRIFKLQDVTELAVKGFKRIKAVYNQYDHPEINMFNIADDTLKEIEELTNAQT